MSNESDRDAFARLFAQHSAWLRAYLVSLLADFASAEEVFQEVCVVLWRKYEQFDPETDFRRWASVIARHKVYQHREKQAKPMRFLSNEVLELVADDAVNLSDALEERRVALRTCLAKLSPNDRKLVSTCYSEVNVSFQKAAIELSRPANTVYKALQRIRAGLRSCIERQIAANQ
ncbi:MAG: sigma-70 family RNA polymerase sigma factor [Planctomycetales bacterium]|nr:sigma-70 family RNA polymerase sigma factor [Planctomycetales bacterium]